ncbi:hypothetical protein ACFQZ4_28680 [Catellatospora coxensis]|uniref:Uncharacterized protein n=1 Tax=Catellatospora coxensis TaxID=310354 RepID=A0A8J3P7Z5_9ACTN|nr:hypothetical protein [Catellatospora coxensis]GIG06873.1 hypothetical protein Cco03nite_35730 [Catellatospora coxensis]
MTARISLAWLAHPVSLLALALLLVNDHVLKAAWPGTVTGKLSDVAGLLVAPPLLAVLVTLFAPRLPSRGVAVGTTVAVGVGFAAVKSSGTAAAAASALWTVVAGPSTVRADLTDLLALPALLGALAVWRHARTRPAPARLTRLLRIGVVLPLAMLGVAATSADQTGTTVSASVDESQRLVVQADRGYLVSTDGGRTFQRQGLEQVDYGELTHSAGMQCLPDRSLCYRPVRDRLRVEQSGDGGSTWTVAWELPERTRELLAREHGGLLGTSGVMSYDLVVLPLESGHVVVAANGRDGLVVRDVTGTWTRVGDGAEPAEPLPSGLLPVRQWFAHIWPELGWVLLAALWCLTAATVVGLHRSGARRSALTVGLIAALGPCLLAMSPLVALDWTHLLWRDGEGIGSAWNEGLTALAGLLLAAGSLAVLIVPVVVVSIGWGRRVLDRRHVRLAIPAGVVVYLPYVVWGSGATTDYRAVSVAALAVFALALIGAIVHAALARPAQPPATWQIPAHPLRTPRAPIDAGDAAAPVRLSSGAAQPTAPGGDAAAAVQQPDGEDAGTPLPGLRSAAPSGGGPDDEATPPTPEG